MGATAMYIGQRAGSLALYLVPSTYRWRWMAKGDRILRCASPGDGVTEHPCLLRRSREAASRRAATEIAESAESEAPTIASVMVEPLPVPTPSPAMTEAPSPKRRRRGVR